MQLKAIAAVSLNGVIGKGPEIPWYIPEDFKWFKETTMGDVLVMGRRTYESIGRPLPGRDTWVLTRQEMEIPKVKVIHQLDEIKSLSEEGRTVWIAGGAEVYKLGLKYCSDLLLTVVQKEVEGDILFPEFEPPFVPQKVLRKEKEFHIIHYMNPSPQAL